MTRDTFLSFIVCFINFLSIYRIQLGDSYKNDKAILILDWHKSLEYPLALKLLKENNIICFILPAHPSHLTQLFDVSIGSPYKSCFTSFYKKFMEELNSSKNNVGQLRYYCVKAALIAWDLKANFYSYSNGAKLTGTNPCSDKYLKNVGNMYT